MKINEILAMLILTATSAVAQDDERNWGCLWVEKNNPGEKLLRWCVLAEGVKEVSCYDIESNQRGSAEEFEPWVIVPADNITGRLEPNEGLCPKLPADIPPVDPPRNSSS